MIKLKPLTWTSIGETSIAYDPLFGVTAMATDTVAYEEERNARIWKEMDQTQITKMKAVEDALSKHTTNQERLNHSRVDHRLAESSWNVHLAGFCCRSDAVDFLQAVLSLEE